MHMYTTTLTSYKQGLCVEDFILHMPEYGARYAYLVASSYELDQHPIKHIHLAA